MLSCNIQYSDGSSISRSAGENIAQYRCIRNFNKTLVTTRVLFQPVIVLALSLAQNHLSHRYSNRRCPVVDDAQPSHKKVQKRKCFSRVRNFSILYGLPIGTLMTFAHTFLPCIHEYWKIRFGITQSEIDPGSSGHHSNRAVCVGELKRGVLSDKY